MFHVLTNTFQVLVRNRPCEEAGRICVFSFIGLVLSSTIMVSTVFITFAAFVILQQVVVMGLTRPDKQKHKWEYKVLAASRNVNYKLYANGRGWIKSNGKSDCDGKWKDAETYGARKKKIKQYCIRLHEKHQDDRGYTDAPKRYDCRLDPNDKGTDHGRKKRDWLCYEKEPEYVLMPPHGPGLNESCPSANPWKHRVFSWYPRDSPPKWCKYNWYEKRQVCWCLHGFYAESPYDDSLKKRGCPKGQVFIVPKFVRRSDLRKLEVSNDTPTAPVVSANVAAESSNDEECICPSPATTFEEFSNPQTR